MVDGETPSYFMVDIGGREEWQGGKGGLLRIREATTSLSIIARPWAAFSMGGACGLYGSV